MVDAAVLAVRLDRLRGYLGILRTVQERDRERFRNDPYIHGTAERYLHLAIECLLDIGNHVISDGGYQKPASYGDIFVILAENGVISAELSSAVKGMAAFRNILVHDYLEIDRDRVYDVLQERLDDLERLAARFGELL